MRPLQLSYPQAPWPAVIGNRACPTVIRVMRDFDTWGDLDLASRADEIVANYEAGHVVVFPAVDLGLSVEDWTLLNSINAKAAENNWFKKAKLVALEAKFVPGEAHVLDHHCPGDRETAAKLQALVVRATARLRQIAKYMFPTYAVRGENITWRLTPNEGEPMHYDSYGFVADPHHHIRMFVNLDTCPRLWGVGPPVDVAIAAYRDRVREFDTFEANLFNAQLNLTLPWEEVARSHVAFAPGNVWLVNSQVVAHEIIYGRKMVACTFDVDPDSMTNRDMFFGDVVRRALREKS